MRNTLNFIITFDKHQNQILYGLNRPYNICVIVPDAEVLLGYAKAKGLRQDMKTLVARKDIIDMISGDTTKHLKGKFGGYEISKKFLLLPEAFSVDDGTLTQTLKLKRNVVLNKLKDQIEALYK